LERGHNVYICGRQAEKLDVALNVLRADFGKRRVAGSQCDVVSPFQVAEMVEKAGLHLGRIDALINNAGIGFISPFEEITDEQWQSIINTNLTGVFNCCKAVLPWLKKIEVSDIVNLGSRAGRYAFAGGTGYNTTKFGLQGFTEALFLDLNKYGIRVSLVAPGTVATGLTKQSSEEWHLLPKDIAKVVGDILESDSRAAVNWVEIRPAKPR